MPRWLPRIPLAFLLCCGASTAHAGPGGTVRLPDREMREQIGTMPAGPTSQIEQCQPAPAQACRMLTLDPKTNAIVSEGNWYSKESGEPSASAAGERGGSTRGEPGLIPAHPGDQPAGQSSLLPSNTTVPSNSPEGQELYGGTHNGTPVTSAIIDAWHAVTGDRANEASHEASGSAPIQFHGPLAPSSTTVPSTPESLGGGTNHGTPVTSAIISAWNAVTGDRANGTAATTPDADLDAALAAARYSAAQRDRANATATEPGELTSLTESYVVLSGNASRAAMSEVITSSIGQMQSASASAPTSESSARVTSSTSHAGNAQKGAIYICDQYQNSTEIRGGRDCVRGHWSK
jgi:hypothetical protein